MRTIIFGIATGIILISFVSLAQNNAVVRGKLVTIKSGTEYVINDYIDSARIETALPIVVNDNLSQVPVNNVPPLPNVGEKCYKNKLYAYNGQVIICLQDHDRTIFNPEIIPNLFNFFRSGTDLEWQINELVAKDDIRIYQGVKYKALMGHTCLMTWTPPATLGVLWGVVTTSSAWAVGVAYKVGDKVTYNGSTYQCLQAHTSISTWYPSVVPALWKKL